MACRLVPWLSLGTLAISVLRHASTEFTGAGYQRYSYSDGRPVFHLFRGSI